MISTVVPNLTLQSVPGARYGGEIGIRARVRVRGMVRVMGG